MPEFVTVAKVADLEDVELKSFEVDDQIIAIAVVGDSYHAFEDTCTHAHCSLSDGDLSGTTVICACHDGEFDVTTGEVLDGPPEEPIITFPLRVVDGEIQIEL